MESWLSHVTASGASGSGEAVGVAVGGLCSWGYTLRGTASPMFPSDEHGLGDALLELIQLNFRVGTSDPFSFKVGVISSFW